MLTVHGVLLWFATEGTLLEQPTMYEDDVNTPESLQRYSQLSLFSAASLLC